MAENGLLSEGERNYLKGKNDYSNYQKRIKEKSEDLPDSIKKVVEDIELLNENDYLSQEIKEEVFEKLTEKKKIKRKSKNKRISMEEMVAYNMEGWKVGKEIGGLVNSLVPLEEQQKIDFLLGCRNRIFPDDPTHEKRVDATLKIPERRNRLGEIKNRYREEYYGEIQRVGKTSKVISDFLDSEYDVNLDGIILNMMAEIGFRGDDEEKIKEKTKDFIEKNKIIEKENMGKKLLEHCDFIKNLSWRGTDGYDVFKKGFKNNNKSSRKDISDSMRKKSIKNLVTKLMRDISKKDPTIVEITGKVYELTKYGKCLRDMLFYREKNFLLVKNDWSKAPPYWGEVLDEHFS